MMPTRPPGPNLALGYAWFVGEANRTAVLDERYPTPPPSWPTWPPSGSGSRRASWPR